MGSLTVNGLSYGRDPGTSLSRGLRAHDEQELTLSLFKEALFVESSGATSEI